MWRQRRPFEAFAMRIARAQRRFAAICTGVWPKFSDRRCRVTRRGCSRSSRRDNASGPSVGPGPAGDAAVPRRVRLVISGSAMVRKRRRRGAQDRRIAAGFHRSARRSAGGSRPARAGRQRRQLIRPRAAPARTGRHRPADPRTRVGHPSAWPPAWRSPTPVRWNRQRRARSAGARSAGTSAPDR